jgi:hypothetical protein
MCEAEITGVEVVYAASPSLMGAYRVTARFAGRGEATFVQAMVDPPKVGEVWSLEEPRLDEMIRPEAGMSKAQRVAGRLYDAFLKKGPAGPR